MWAHFAALTLYFFLLLVFSSFFFSYSVFGVAAAFKASPLHSHSNTLMVCIN